MTEAKNRPPMSRAEAGRLGGLSTGAVRTPEQRRASASRANLASAVSAVVRRAEELTPEQFELLRSTFGK